MHEHSLISPNHGYLKNLSLAILGKMDQPFTALWDHGHIKFWSMPTLTTLLNGMRRFGLIDFTGFGQVIGLG